VRKFILFLLGALFIVLAYFEALKIIESNTKKSPIAEKAVKPVFVDTIVNKTIPITISANGILIAKNKMELFAEVQGIFQSSTHDFKVGQRYRNGETLLQLAGQLLNIKL
jgi:multidrug efflux pump subunit AcrA (membrane-fusion protein)